MAFTVDNLVTDGELEVVLRVDDALDMTDDEYDEYLKTLDPALLSVKPGADVTTFVMRRSIPLKHAMDIENSKVKFTKDGEVDVQMAYTILEVRACLKGIKYADNSTVPEDKRIKLKFTGDGLVDDKQMAAFVSAGIVNNLYNARAKHLKASASGSLKKN